MAYIFLTFGVLSLLRCIIFFVRRRKMKVIYGEVIRLEEETDSEGTVYFPVVKYYDDYHKVNQCYKSKLGFNPCGYSVGNKIRMRFSVKNGRTKVNIDTPLIIIVTLLPYFILSFTMLLIGIINFFFN